VVLKSVLNSYDPCLR